MKTYIVKSGDWLSKIAGVLGVTTDQLMKWNPEIVNPNLIEVGQRIVYYTDAAMAISTPAATVSQSQTVLSPLPTPLKVPSLSIIEKIMDNKAIVFPAIGAVAALMMFVVYPRLKKV